MLGPFYVQEPPEMPLGASISPGLDGVSLLVTGSVSAPDGTRVERPYRHLHYHFVLAPQQGAT